MSSDKIWRHYDHYNSVETTIYKTDTPGFYIREQVTYKTDGLGFRREVPYGEKLIFNADSETIKDLRNGIIEALGFIKDMIQ